MATFFNLPPELRYMVYHYVWQAYPINRLQDDFESEGGPITVFCKYPSDGSVKKPSAGVGLPSWLLTNQAFLSEGLDQLSRGGHLEIIPIHAKYCNLAFPAAYQPSVCRSVCIKLYARGGRRKRNSKKMPLGELDPEDLNYCDRLLKGVVGKDGVLRHLEVRITSCATEKMSKRVDLAPLGAVLEVVAHQLKRLEVVIGVSDIEDMRRDAIEEMLPLQLEQLDKGSLAAMVGETGKGGTFSRVISDEGQMKGWHLVWTCD